MSLYAKGIRTRLGSIYHNMKTRCTNPNYDKYQYYGGKGVSVCDEWLNSYDAFEQWALSHGYADGLTLERIDVHGDYTPENCRWSSRKDQANNRTSNHYIEYNGVTKTMMQWCEDLGLEYGMVSQRLRNGWSVERAFTEPHHNTNKTRLITFRGQTKRLYEWAKDVGLPFNVLYNRLDKGWTVEQALTTPSGGQRHG